MNKEEIKKHYSSGIEQNRLEHELFQLEGIRTKEIISRYIHDSKMDIIDIGGGPGYYSFWLKEKGHHVSLIDFTPKNIELAKEYTETNKIRLDRLQVGDATHLDFEDNSFDIAPAKRSMHQALDVDKIYVVTKS